MTSRLFSFEFFPSQNPECVKKTRGIVKGKRADERFMIRGNVNGTDQDGCGYTRLNSWQLPVMVIFC